MRTLTCLALVALAACGDKEARYNEKCGGPWYANVDDHECGSSFVFGIE